MTLAKKMRLLSITAIVAINAQNLNQQCETTLDCPEGTACVAGVDATQSIQTCVKFPACGGDAAGNCPVLLNDQLTCSFVQDQSCSQSGGLTQCKDFDGTSGIFKCLSLEACNGLFGSNACSDTCAAANGKACNGRGTCESIGKTDFQCRCNDGWSGAKCETVTSATCTVGVGDCGRSGTCEAGACVCTNDWTGVQCENPPEASSKDQIIGVDSRETPNPDVPTSNSAVDESSSGNAGAIIGILVSIGVFAIAALVFITKRSRQKQREEETGPVFLDDADSGTGFSATLEAPLTPIEGITTF